MERQCQRALTRKRTLWGGGALEVGDLRLLEDGSERGGALVPNSVAKETADTMDEPQNVAKKAHATVRLLTYSLTLLLRCGSGKAG